MPLNAKRISSACRGKRETHEKTQTASGSLRDRQGLFSLVAGFLLADHDAAVHGQRVEQKVMTLAVFVREQAADAGPVGFLAFASVLHGIGAEDGFGVVAGCVMVVTFVWFSSHASRGP